MAASRYQPDWGHGGPPKLVVALLVLHAVALAYASTVHSPTRDEVGHLPAGISHWRSGNFDLYRVNPPLVRLLATFPVVLAGADTDWPHTPTSQKARQDFAAGRDFFQKNGSTAFWYLTVARWACIPFSLIGAIVCWRWATLLYGPASGMIALLLWCICPNILGHGQLITPDVAAASLGSAALFGFWLWLRSPTWSRAFFAGALLGIAELSKTTWIILFPLSILLWAIWNRFNKTALSVPQWISRSCQMGTVLLMAIYLINLGYGFEGTLTSLREFEFSSITLAGDAATGSPARPFGNRFAGSPLGLLPVPVPKNYLLGIDRQKRDFEDLDWSYLRGAWRTVGWHYYYLYAMSIKIPLGTLLVIGLAVFCSILCRSHATLRSPSIDETCTDGQHPSTWRDSMILLVPAAAVLLLVSSQVGFNRHLRYVLPAFPLLFIWGSSVGARADFAWLASIPDRLAIGIRCLMAREERPRHDSTSSSLPSVSETDLVGSTSCRQSTAGRATAMFGLTSPQCISRALAVVVVAALGWSATSSLLCYPHNLAYFNELIGGPRNGHWHLSSSNVDWGEDLFYVKDWYDQHPEARPFHFRFRMPLVDPTLVGIEYGAVPQGPPMNRKGTPKTRNWPWGDVGCSVDDLSPRNLPPAHPTALGPLPGWYAISMTEIHRHGGTYEYLTEFDAVDTVGYSVNIYHVTRDEANRLRRKLGLPELPLESSASH